MKSFLPKHIFELNEKFIYLKNNNKSSVQETCIKQIYRSWFLKPGGVGLDIGAHSGLHTFDMAQLVGESGNIIAFEANPSLALNLTKQSLGLKQITVINAACSNESKEYISFYNNIECSGQSTIIKGYGNNFTDKNEIKVPCISIDNFLGDYLSKKRLAFIKIDAEGAEFEILSGMKQLLKVKYPLICAEISLKKWMDNLDAFKKLLVDINYSCFLINGLEITDLDYSILDNIYIPSYTMVFCKKSHWSYEFASDREKMFKIVNATIDKTIQNL